MNRPNRLVSALALALALTPFARPAAGRVLSYAPLSDRRVVPAVQERTNRHFALIEIEDTVATCSSPASVLTLHDSHGLEEPRVVLGSGLDLWIRSAALFEDGDAVYLLAQVASRSGAGEERLQFSADAGRTWKTVTLPAGEFLAGGQQTTYPVDDAGGSVAGPRDALVLPGRPGTPFVFNTRKFTGYVYTKQTWGLYALSTLGEARLLARTLDPLYEGDDPDGVLLLGSDAGRGVFVVQGRPAKLEAGAAYDVPEKRGLHTVDLSGRRALLAEVTGFGLGVRAWIATGGAVYLHEEGDRLLLASNGSVTEVAAPPKAGGGVVAIPTADFAGAWVATRAPGLPTTLYRHAPGGALVSQWADATGPEIEALHAGRAGTRVLVQVHRPRPQVDERIIVDPALAIWTVGAPAPAHYDELFLKEQPTKGFVNLDVDAVAQGGSFVFDSGTTPWWWWGPCAGGPSGDAPGSGGGDVVQEWGAVRASLRQELIVPSVARAPGMHGAYWRTELVLQNPSTEPLTVRVEFLPGPSVAGPSTEYALDLALGPAEIRILDDVLSLIHGIDGVSGALRITPEGTRSVVATSRTYTAGGGRVYGMGVPAVEATNAASARFRLTFAAGLQGAGFRTNLASTDVSGRGAAADLVLRGAGGQSTTSSLFFETPRGGVQQISSLASWYGAPPSTTGALVLAPRSGELVPSLMVIDDVTNDPTYFPPDLPSPVARTIPAIVHVNGSNGAVFRSDLYVFNPAGRPVEVIVAAKTWAAGTSEQIQRIPLQPGEARIIRDALPALFGMTGVARFRFQTAWTPADATDGVRITSRTYAVAPGGGTYGLLMPPLNAFQAASSGDALAILGARTGSAFRTNLALVDVRMPTASLSAAKARVELIASGGATLDSFEVTIPAAGGTQVDDVLRARGLRDDAGPVLIVVRPTEGLVSAYATLVHNVTNDPIYLPAGLAAR